MGVVPARCDDDLPKVIEQSFKIGTLIRQSLVQLLANLAGCCLRIKTSLSDRAKVVGHRVDGSVAPAANLFGGRVEKIHKALYLLTALETIPLKVEH